MLRILRPAESALRRLIILVAAVLEPGARPGTGAGKPLPDFASFSRQDKLPAFRLTDPRRHIGVFARQNRPGMPRISVPGWTVPAPAAPPANHGDGTAILRRIAVLDHALKGLPRQARRLARLMARHARFLSGTGRAGPLRRGYPPGYRRRSRHEVDAVLRECHMLVRDRLAGDGCFKPP